MTDRIESLQYRVETFLNRQLTPIGEHALTAFLALPGVEKWSPENFYGLEVDLIFNYGLPFAIIGHNQSAHKFRINAGRSIIGEIGLSPSDMSEIHVCALLSHWGMNPNFVETTKAKTPDIECNSSNGLVLDIEVVRADRRHDHKKVQDSLTSFTGALQPGDIDSNLACFMADASNNQELNAVFDAALRLAPGNSTGVEGRWMVVAVPLERGDEFISQVELFAPEWWPKESACFIANSVLLGSPVTITIRSLVPLVKYLGPIVRKANQPQSRRGHPFLIAMDSMELPRAHDRIPPELDEYFSLWDHVSGVLILDARFWAIGEKKEYYWSIHTNPHACIPLPADLVSRTGKMQIETFILSSKLSP